MIRISKKTDYAIFLMGYLARAASSGGPAESGRGLVSAQDLAAFSTLNKSVVANLLKDLTRAGLLTSVRGVRGGYRLSRPAEDISLAEILEALDGPFVLVECAESGVSLDAHEDDCGCNLSSFCTTKRPLQVLQHRIAGLIDDLKLSELCGLHEINDPFATNPTTTQPTRATE